MAARRRRARAGARGGLDRTDRSRRPAPRAARAHHRRHRQRGARRRAAADALARDRAGRHRRRPRAAPRRRPGRVPAARHLRQRHHGTPRARGGLARRRTLGRDRHPALHRPQASGRRGRDHDPRGAPADRRLSGAPHRRGDRGHPPRLPVGDALRRRTVGRADERRAGHPSAAHPDERGTAGVQRALRHPPRGHAALGACGDRHARPGAHRGARGARLGHTPLPAARPLHLGPLDVRRRPQAPDRLGRLARAHRPACAPLHDRGHGARPGLPHLLRAEGRGRGAGGERPARDRLHEGTA